MKADAMGMGRKLPCLPFLPDDFACIVFVRHVVEVLPPRWKHPVFWWTYKRARGFFGACPCRALEGAIVAVSQVLGLELPLIAAVEVVSPSSSCLRRAQRELDATDATMRRELLQAYRRERAAGRCPCRAMDSARGKRFN